MRGEEVDMSHFRTLFSLVVLVGMAAPVAAQDGNVLRRSFAYFDRSLTVEVDAGTPGSLRLMRAGNSRIEVAAAARNGLPGVGIGGLTGDRLRLSAVGGSNVDYLVLVPENIQVRVQLPDQSYALPAVSGPQAVYSWGGPTGAEPTTGLRTGDALYLTYSADAAPAEIVIQDLASVRRLGVRTGGSAFRIETSRPLAATPGSATSVTIHAVGEPIDILLTLPQGTSDFTLRVPEGVAFSISNGESQVRCGPSVSQLLRDGRRAIDITPVGGTVQCEGN